MSFETFQRSRKTHGTYSCWQDDGTGKGCRCVPCKAARNDYLRAWRARRRDAGLNARGDEYRVDEHDGRRRIRT